MKWIISSYKDVQSIIEEVAFKRMGGCTFLYRGHASTSFKLLSMVGRKMPINGNLQVSELNCFQDFVKLAKKRDWLDFKLNSCNKELFYMSIGRHLGLDCRLLDWTASIETALFFATSEEKLLEEDGHLWIMAFNESIDNSKTKNDPFTVDELTLIKEDYYIPDDHLIKDQPLGILRRFRQHGFFTITPFKQLTIPLDEIDNEHFHFYPIVIKACAKNEILEKIDKNKDFLYLAKHYRIEDDIKKINTRYFEQ